MKDARPTRSLASRGPLAWIRSRPEGSFIAATVGLLSLGTACVLVFDYRALREAAPAAAVVRPDLAQPAALPAAEPDLPSSRPGVPAGPPSPTRDGARPPDILREAMTFDLVEGGRLLAVGTLAPGTSDRFAQEIAKRGSYVKTVVLDSPGGSVADALAMGRLIREKRLSTSIEAGGRCASSCPLVLAGGVERRVSDKAAVGVHQVFAAGKTAGEPRSGDLGLGMDQAQRISAECQRHLVDLGVDARVWMHAMETPKETLFYFTARELMSLSLATAIERTAPAEPPTARAPRS